MTDPILRLDPERLGVDPGGRASLTLSVHNPGTIVEGYVVDVVSTTPIEWVRVEPETLSVYPQQEATAEVVFAPPSGPGAPGGTVPFGVRVRSQADGGGSAVAEGDLDVGSVAGLQAKLTPIASTGRWNGRHTLKVSNWGNAPARLRITAEDPDQALGFLVNPDVVDVPLGGEVVARLKVRTRRPTLRGSAHRWPFQVACTPDTASPDEQPTPAVSTPGRPVVEGAFHQKPILTRTVVALAVLAVVAAVAGLVWLLNRSDDESPEGVQQPDPPTGLALAQKSGIVTLSWDRVEGIEEYKAKMTAPVDGEAPLVVSPVADDTTRVESKIKAETEDVYCYRVIAVREGAPDSAPSEEQCITTQLPATATPGPTESPTIVPVVPPPAGTGDDGGSDGGASPDTSGGTTPTPGDSADPQRFLAVVALYLDAGSTDPAGLAETARAQLAEKGFETKVLSTRDWAITPSLGPSHLLYVDATSAADARAACEAIRAVSPESVKDDCLPLQVTGPAPSGSPSP